MEITGENGVVYKFDITEDKFIISILWKGVPIKRFTMKASRDNALQLRAWLSKQTSQTP